MTSPRVTILHLPSPPGMDVQRDYSGGYGTAGTVRRARYGHSGSVVFPVFMPYLASALRRRGWHFSVVDAQVRKSDLDTTVRAVAETRPDFVVALVSLPSMYGDLALLDHLKQRLPDCILVLVGTTGRVLSDEILKCQAVGFIVDAEYPFYGEPIIRLIDAWQGHNLPSEKVIRPALAESRPSVGAMAGSARSTETHEAQGLDDLDLDVYHLFPMRGYHYGFVGEWGELTDYFPILSSKGCPFPCIYCPYPVGFGKTISYKSPEVLVREMQFLRAEFGIRAFLFRDQVFTAKRDRIEEICDLILARGLDVKWLFETRVDRVSRDLLLKVKKAGCNRIHYGIETGDANLLGRIGKPGVDKQAAVEAFRNTAALGIRTVAHVIVGLPGETRQTLTNTYEFLGELDPDNTSWNFATPYPGTRLFEIAREKGQILTFDWTQYNTNNVVMRTDELSGSELCEIVRRLVKKDRTRKVLKRVRRAVYDKRDRRYVVRRSLSKLAGLAGR